MKKILIIIFGISIVLFSVNKSNAQDCQGGDYCEVDDMGDYDYASQSVFGYAYPGDTIIIKTAIYANKKYNFWVCGVPELGDLEWEIVKPVRKTRKIIERTNIDTTIIYKMTTQYDDEMEEDVEVEMTDDDGNMIVDKVEITKDTIYKSIRYTDEVRMFSSKKAPNWEKGSRKTQRIWIKFVIPNTASDDGGCYGVYIGRINTANGKRKFKRGQRRVD